jgi:hypothetical protein
MNVCKELHRDEEGLQTLQVVCIVAVAAIILALVKVYWNDIKNWVAVVLAPIFSF